MRRGLWRVLSVIAGIPLMVGGVAFFVWWAKLQFDDDWMWRNGPLLIPAFILFIGGSALLRFGRTGNFDLPPPSEKETDIF